MRISRSVVVKEEDFDRIAKTSLNDGAILANPVEVSYDGIMEILKKHIKRGEKDGL